MRRKAIIGVPGCLFVWTVTVAVHQFRFLALLYTIIVFDANLRQLYIAFRADDARRRYISDVVEAMSSAAPDDPALLDDLCPICFGELAASGRHGNAVTSCGHVYHRGCLARWLAEQPFCPKCRAELRDREGEGRMARVETVSMLERFCVLLTEAWTRFSGQPCRIEFGEAGEVTFVSPAIVINF